MIQNVDEEPEVERQEKIKKLKKQLQLLLEESEPKNISISTNDPLYDKTVL
ncbi:MAG: hypothetical protein V8Q92_00110 [Coprococcus comes]